MMTPEEFNSWACDIANDYEQARQEMGPDDYESWEAYSQRRLAQRDAMDSNDLRDLIDPVKDYGITIKQHDTTCDDDDLPF
jgi:hypothetical protein